MKAHDEAMSGAFLLYTTESHAASHAAVLTDESSCSEINRSFWSSINEYVSPNSEQE